MNRFNVVYWQHLTQMSMDAFPIAEADSAEAIDGTVTWSGQGQLSFPRLADTVLEFDVLNQTIAAEFRRISLGTPTFSPGMFRFHGWTQLGECGLLVNLDKAICLIGDIVGWGMDFTKWYTQIRFGARWSDNNQSFEIDLTDLQVNRVPGEAIMLSAPGQDIYGHWLLDYIPRISSVSEISQQVLPVYLTTDKTWMQDILGLVRLAPGRYNSMGDRQRTEYDTALVPGFLKRGYIIHEDLCGKAWAAVRAKVRAEAPAATIERERIYVSRAELGGPRVIANCLELEEIALSCGYVIVHPERLSVGEQVLLFRSAKLVVGQDGSGLHNIIFADSLIGLGVLGLPERRNLWHLSICSALSAKIAYAEAELTEGGYRVATGRFRVMLGELEKI